MDIKNHYPIIATHKIYFPYVKPLTLTHNTKHILLLCITNTMLGKSFLGPKADLDKNCSILVLI